MKCHNTQWGQGLCEITFGSTFGFAKSLKVSKISLKSQEHENLDSTP